MQAYGPVFARVYNHHWAGFARRVAPLIREFYEDRPVAAANRTLLDLCCGTGQLALHFLDSGYRVTGLDLSLHMLRCAAENAGPYIASGQARFIQADASDFAIHERFGLAVSTYDALNHLSDLAALRRCFACVFRALAGGGYFVFDLNTRTGLQRWNNLFIEDTEEFMLVTRGVYDGRSDRAWTRISGFVRAEGGLYERFAEHTFNTVYDLAAVAAALTALGWSAVHFARVEALAVPLDDPEREGRVFVVARK